MLVQYLDPVYDDWTFYETLRGGGYACCTPTQVRAGQTATIGTTKLQVLGPKTPHLEGTSEDENNNSILLKITDGASNIVLTGDTENAQWDSTDDTLLHFFSGQALSAAQPMLSGKIDKRAF